MIWPPKSPLLGCRLPGFSLKVGGVGGYSAWLIPDQLFSFIPNINRGVLWGDEECRKKRRSVSLISAPLRKVQFHHVLLGLISPALLQCKQSSRYMGNERLFCRCAMPAHLAAQVGIFCGERWEI